MSSRIILDDEMLDWLWKKLQNIRFSSTDKAYYEEDVTKLAGVITRPELIFSPSEDPPSPAAGGDDITAVVLQSMTAIAAEDDRAWDSGDDKWVEPGWGGTDYAVHIYDADDDEIALAGPPKWFFDYTSGTVYFEHDPVDDGWAKPLKISGYKWTGKTLNQVWYPAEEGSAPTTPKTGSWGLYFKSGGLYTLEDDGTEIGPLGPAYRKKTKIFYIEDPASGGTYPVMRTHTDVPITITKVFAESDAGTPDIHLWWRAPDAQFAGGTQILTAALTAGATETDTTSFADATIPGARSIWCEIDDADVATKIIVTIEYTED